MGDQRLSAKARQAIEADTNERLLSIASAWEMAIKVSIGRLTLASPLGELLREQSAANDIALLPVTLNHTDLVATMPFHHRDPFDRLIVAQALHEQLPIVSGDEVVSQYGVERIW